MWLLRGVYWHFDSHCNYITCIARVFVKFGPLIVYWESTVVVIVIVVVRRPPLSSYVARTNAALHAYRICHSKLNLVSFFLSVSLQNRCECVCFWVGFSAADKHTRNSLNDFRKFLFHFHALSLSLSSSRSHSALAGSTHSWHILCLTFGNWICIYVFIIRASHLHLVGAITHSHKRFVTCHS